MAKSKKSQQKTTTAKSASSKRTSTKTTTTGGVEFVRKLALAGVGAAFLAREEFEKRFDKLVEKGEKLDKEGKLDLNLDTKRIYENFKDTRDYLETRANSLFKNVNSVRGDLENRIDKFVGKVRTSVKTAKTSASRTTGKRRSRKAKRA